jgi:hypothetical protein
LQSLLKDWCRTSRSGWFLVQHPIASEHPPRHGIRTPMALIEENKHLEVFLLLQPCDNSEHGSVEDEWASCLSRRFA